MVISLVSKPQGIDLTTSYVQIIDGVTSPTNGARNGINPASLEPLGDVPLATKEDLDRAVDAGKEAFKTWSKIPYDERRTAVLAFAAALFDLRSEFGELLTREQGKPVVQATRETEMAVDWMRGLADIPLPEETIIDDENRRVVTRYTPLGVVAGLVPWNFPLLLAASKIAPALLTGNVIIIKPSPFTPYCGLKLVELAQRFFPRGVVQSLSGDDNLGPWITSHPGIDKISFTGSTNTGKAVMQSASKTLKRVTLELYYITPFYDVKRLLTCYSGGNDPAIIFPDVDVVKVAHKVAFLAFLNSGQICLNLKRIYVHESIFDEFKDALVDAVQDFTIGNGLDFNTSHGPVQNSMQYERVNTFFNDIESQGWKVAIGGKSEYSGLPGFFIFPTVIDRPPEESRIVVEEPFGPIVPLLSWKDEDDVISRANASNMGLGASVWTNNLDRATRVAKEIQAGTVWINTHFELNAAVPFGGHKESGIGTELGLSGLKGFCNSQTLFLNKNPLS